MAGSSRVCLAAPLSPYRDGLRAELLARGYARVSSANLVLVLGDLSRWMEARGLGATRLDSEEVAAFLRYRRVLGFTRWTTRRGLEPILRYLRRIGAVPAEQERTPSTPLEITLKGYEDYLLGERGLSCSTVQGYLELAAQFLSERLGNEATALELSAKEVTSFILREARSCSVGYAKRKVGGLRSLLRYLHVRGMVTGELAGAVPAVPHRRLVGLPKYITHTEVQRLLRGCDRRTSRGRRDFAALLLMIRLGLRASEVASLSLDDLHWRRAELIVRGKPNREDRLPLAEDLGQALVAYLKRRRPRSGCRRLFLQLHAPYEGLSRHAISSIVRRAGRRIGFPLNAHRLRHTAATEMLRRGASLPEIAQALRHRNFDTTAIYAKVDRRRLGALGQPWPGGRR